MSAVISGLVLRGSGTRRAALFLLPLLGALALCVMIDVGLVTWIRAGAPAGKGDIFFVELVILIAGALVISAAALLAPLTFQKVLPFAWMVIAWHTGFQVPLSHNVDYALTVFDVIIPITLFLGIIGQWYQSESGVRTWASENWAFLVIFWGFCLWGLTVAILRGVQVPPMVANMKPFLLYPLIAVMAPWCIRTWKHLYWVVGAMVALILERSLDGLYQFFISHHTYFSALLRNHQIVSRINGNMADTNQFAMYVLSGVLILTALVVSGKSTKLRLAMLPLLMLMTLALMLTFTRGAWLGLVLGLLALMFTLSWRRVLLLAGLVVLIGVVIQLVHPTAATEIFLRSTDKDASILERQKLYSLGFTVLQQFPFGAGWGAYFARVPGGIVPSNLFPWYHDDYVQLATEIGIPGLAVFVTMLGSMFLYAVRAYRPLRTTAEGALQAGLIASFAGVLVQSGTDQFLWHADIAPHVWIVGGLMISCAALLRQRAGITETDRADVVKRLGRAPVPETEAA